MKTKVFGIVVFMLVLVSSFSNVFGIEILGPLDDEWNIDEIESNVNAGKYNSIALDSNDYPHISHFKGNSNSGELKYAKWTGTEWSNIVLDSSEITGLYSSICLDDDDYPHICYYDYSDDNLNYVKWTGTDWDYDTVDYDGDVGSWCSLALDSSDNPHISYRDSTNKDLKYAYKTGSTWTDETVVSSGDVGYFTSIALDSNDYPRISYVGLSSNGTFYLKHIQWTGNSWKYNTLFIDIGTGIIDEGEIYGFSSLAIDTDDKSHIAYWRNYNDDPVIRYAKQASSPYVFSRVSVDDGNPFQGKLVLDPNNLPHISYCRSLKQKYAHKLGGITWFISYVSSSFSGLYSSIDLDSNDLPCISFWKLGLYYATSTNFPPNVPNVPSGPSSVVQGDTETYCTSGFDPNGDQVQYRFDWGDGTTSDWTSFVNSGETACKSYSWSSGGFFNVKAQARDEWGASSGWSNSLTVDVFGCDAGDPYKGFKNYHVNFIGSADGGTGSYEYRWDFKNDGFYDTSWSNSNTATYTYSPAGSYTVKMQARESGGRTHTDTSEVTIKNLPIVVEDLLSFSGKSLERSGEHFYVNIPFNTNDLDWLINIIGNVPEYVFLGDFSGLYQFLIDWGNSEILIDLYPYDPQSNNMEFSDDLEFYMETYLPKMGGYNLGFGTNSNFPKNGDEFEWELSVYLNGDILFPEIEIDDFIKFIPIYGNMKFKVGADVEFFVSPPSNWDQYVFENFIGKLIFKLETDLGLGFDDICGIEIYSEAYGELGFQTPEVGGSIFDSFFMKIEIGVSGEFLFQEIFRWPFIKEKYPKNAGSNDPTWEFITRDYENPDWINDEKGVILDDAFLGTHPYTARNSNDDRIMVWVQDDVNITSPGAEHGDALDIWFSTWNQNTKKWNYYDQVTNDNYLQSNPSVAMLDTGDAICVFSCLDESAATKTEDEVFNETEIGFSFWDGSSWSDPEYVVAGGTSGHKMDSYPIIKSDGNEAVVVWLCDNDADVFTVNDRALYASFWDGNNWGNTNIISTQDIISAPVSLAFKNGEAVCAYAVDEDGTLATREDGQNIYMTTFSNNSRNSNTEAITNSGKNAHPSINYIDDGNPSISWVLEEKTNDNLSVKILYLDNVNSRTDPEVVESGINSISSAPLIRMETSALEEEYIPLVGWNDGNNICYKRRFSGVWEDTLILHESPETITQTAWEYDGGDELYAVFVEKDNITSHQDCQMRIAGMGQMLTPGPPIEPIGPILGYINETYEYSTYTTDPTPLDALYYKWDWGDGNQSNWLGPYNSEEPCKANHSWINIDTYDIRVKAKNNYRESEWSDPLTVGIRSHPPSKPKITGPSSGVPGEIYEFKFVSTEPDGEQIEYKVDWGDGDIVEWFGPFESGEEITLTHSWEEKGSYTIHAKARDKPNDEESEWSNRYIQMPRNRMFKSKIFEFAQIIFERFKLLRDLLANTIINWIYFRGVSNE